MIFPTEGHFYVQHGEVFDVIWPGRPNTGNTPRERARNAFPRYVCSCPSKPEAEQLVGTLDAAIGLM